jgi:hypothetical protein
VPDKRRHGGIQVRTGVRTRLPDPLPITGAVWPQEGSGFGLARAVVPILDRVVAIPDVRAPRQRAWRPLRVIHQLQPRESLRRVEPDEESKSVIPKPAAWRFPCHLPCVADLREHARPSLGLPGTSPRSGYPSAKRRGRAPSRGAPAPVATASPLPHVGLCALRELHAPPSRADLSCAQPLQCEAGHTQGQERDVGGARGVARVSVQRHERAQYPGQSRGQRMREPLARCAWRVSRTGVARRAAAVATDYPFRLQTFNLARGAGGGPRVRLPTQ